MENITKKFQEYTDYAHKSDEVYDAYEKLDDKRQELSKELESLTIQKYLPLEKLKNFLPWIPEKNLDTWERCRAIHYKSTMYIDGDNTTFIVEVMIRTMSHGPILYVRVKGNEDIKINLIDSEDEINKAITHSMESINEARLKFIEKVKTELNI